jgi:AcrR family transcriptional regulator
MAGAAPKMDARMVRTQQSLRAAFLALIQRQTLDEISIRDIVAEAGIGYATFFRHYPSKAALLESVVADEISELVNLSLPVLDPDNTLESSLALFRHVDEHRALWAALLTGGAAGTIREEFARETRERGPAHIQLDNWLPTELGVQVGVASTIEIIAWWLRQGRAVPVESIAEIHNRLCLLPTVANAIKPGGL